MSRRLRHDRLHRFLRPGALARLRDSRISARSPRSSSKAQLLLPCLPPSSPSPSPDQIDGFPCFYVRVSGPRRPQRKRLAASKSIFFVASSPTNPSSPEPSDQVLDFISGADLLVAR
ncbi:hypothetical protein IHE45_15G106700 [Dioscorea alata]|uniref:Uncharacterized protein LOC120277968 n=2 Tax=Dioscorea TaxID=4672 RepID=A0AB40CLD5_DIOCR|nr:uncharacterized protein LOC120277968 [Dioscorea cayenensis subsp. rotundata]KAH7662066.1 hypothetical protein IHE45_15G106700 [Dioscorea alata]